MSEAASVQNRELFMNKTRKHIFISIITLILASLACGTVQVGVGHPNLVKRQSCTEAVKIHLFSMVLVKAIYWRRYSLKAFLPFGVNFAVV